jgi:TIGR03009 family protein
MRIFFSVFVSILFLSASASAQQPDLDAILKGWEKTISGIENFALIVERRTVDKALAVTDEYKGTALFAKAAKKGESTKALLQLEKVNNPNVSEKYVYTGSELHWYNAANKTVRVHKVPNLKQMGLPENAAMGFALGIGAAEVKKRFDIELVTANPPDKHYHYIRVRPKTPQDKADFTEARLALYRDTNLPAQWWYVQPNKNEVTWNFTKIQLNMNLPGQQIDTDIPPGWQVIPVAPPALPPAKK